jgi:hypothetical protein
LEIDFSVTIFSDLQNFTTGSQILPISLIDAGVGPKGPFFFERLRSQKYGEMPLPKT